MEILLLLILVLVPFIAQLNISDSYNRNRRIANSKGLCGQEVARKILDANGLDRVHVVEVKGNLTDHYDSRQKVVRLSTEVFHGESVAALAIAAHECGHAIQDKENYAMLRFRSMLAPLFRVISISGYIFLIISIFLQVLDYLVVALVVSLFGLLFHIVTLPVEFNASSRAKEQIKKLSLTTKKEDDGVSNVLGAAAFTYVASVISQVLDIVRILIKLDRRR